jgi:hypothetical protein
MANAYDPYREALVVETNTIWPEECDDLDARQRQRIAQELHANPQAAASLDYVRMHTGFCREITVTSADLERVT